VRKPDPPAHIIRHGGDDRTLCGIKLKEKAALPYLWAAHVPAHQRGRNIKLCSDCRVAYHWLLQEVGR
jgi:hypothetical protein